MASMLRVGAAEVVITPPVGTALAGYFAPRISEGVIYDLKAKAVVAGEGAEAVAVISCDLICVPKPLVAAARAEIEAATGIPAARIMVAATHTHTGPETGGSRDLIPRNVEYLATLPGLIARAAIMAAQNQRDCVLAMGSDSEEGLAFNRRFRLRDGTEQFGPGPDPDELAGVAGPTDPQLSVLTFAEPGCEPFAVMVNYALHIDVTSGNLISADYPAVITETVRGVYGPETVVLFLNGACGNINHVPYTMERAWPLSGNAKSRQIGKALGGKAVCIAEKALPSLDQTVDAAGEVLQVPAFDWDDVLDSRLADARSRAEPNFFEETLLRWVEGWDPEGVEPVESQVIRLGDAVLCSAPGELFVEWGLEMKKWSPFPLTLVVELANDSVGYIPTYEAFRRGGYEATPVVSVPLTPALGQLLTDANFRSCQKLWRRRQG